MGNPQGMWPEKEGEIVNLRKERKKKKMVVPY